MAAWVRDLMSGRHPTFGIGDSAHAAFPNLTFLQILFGYRTVEELQDAFADCRANGDLPRLLLNALFPKRSSAVWPMA